MTAPAAATDFNASLGERAHMLMWRQNKTQVQIGRIIGIEQSLLSKKLRGAVRWYGDEISSLAKALHTSVGFLVGETSDPNPPMLPRLDSNQQPSD